MSALCSGKTEVGKENGELEIINANAYIVDEEQQADAEPLAKPYIVVSSLVNQIPAASFFDPSNHSQFINRSFAQLCKLPIVLLKRTKLVALADRVLIKTRITY